MKEFWFIRHGESLTNAGMPSESDQTTGLTEKGSQQSGYVTNAIQQAPDLFVISPYLRTQLTAAPTLEKFPNVPVETWPIQEYTYLSHQQYAGTTNKERRNLSVSYFRKGDPDLVLGDGGESFSQFIGRVEDCIQRLKTTNHAKIILFGHGWFIRASLWVLLQNLSGKKRDNFYEAIKTHINTTPWLLWMFQHTKVKKSIRSFLLFSAGVETPNCSILKYQLNDSGELILSGFDVSHLPEEYRITTLRNR